MFLLLFANLIACGVILNKPIAPHSYIEFVEKLGADDQKLVLVISNLSKAPGLRMKITAPKAEPAKKKMKKMKSMSFSESSEPNTDSEDLFGETVADSVNKSFTVPGKYQISIHNSEKTEIEFSIASYVHKKINETNKDVLELRNTLYSLQTAMESLGNENYFLRNYHAKNIAEANFIESVLKWLFLFPLITILIGYLRQVFAEQLVKPKGKRFKGLF